MRATGIMTAQLNAINSILHDIAEDLTPAELTTRVLPNTNLIAFDLWHVARAQDCSLNTFVLGVPELIDDPRWAGRGQLVTYGIGIGMTEAQADALAHSLKLADILEYADAVHAALVGWLGEQPDDALDAPADVTEHYLRYPVYLSDAMRAEVPWAYEKPPVWRCLNPALGHAREHLGVVELLKQQMRARSA